MRVYTPHVYDMQMQSDLREARARAATGNTHTHTHTDLVRGALRPLLILLSRARRLDCVPLELLSLELKLNIHV
jgi:hypothetical protein